MWGWRKRFQSQLDQLEKAVDKLLAKLDDRGEPARASTAEAFANLLGKQIDNQGSLVAAFGDIAVRAAARRAGIRGGKTRAATGERSADGRYLPGRRKERQPECPLCVNPMHRPVTVEMIQAHRRHETTGERLVNQQAQYAMEPSEPDSADQTNHRQSEPG